MDISQELHTIAEYSRDEAQRTGCYTIRPEHLALAVIRLRDCTAHAIISEICSDMEGLKNALDRAVCSGRQIPFEDADGILPENEVKNCMSLAVVEAQKLGSMLTSSEHLLLSISRHAPKPCRDILSAYGVNPQTILASIKQTDSALSTKPSRKNESATAGTGADPVHTPEPRPGTTGEAEAFLLQEMHRLAYDKATAGAKGSERS